MRDLARVARDPLRFLVETDRRKGPVSRFRVATKKFTLLNEPDQVKQVLITHHRSFEKGRGLKIAQRMLGKGLLTSEGSLHRARRRLMQPLFARDKVERYQEAMSSCALRLAESWQDGQEIELSHQMMGLTLAIVGEALFGSDLESEVEELGAAVDQSLALFRYALLPGFPLLERLIPSLRRRFEQASGRIEQQVDAMIAESSGQDDLLSVLLGREQELGRQGVREEAVTLLLAGHETTANALSWTLFLLATHPHVANEVRHRLALQDSTYLRAVVAESLRLYPPAWVIGRRALEPVELSDLRIARGETVLMSPYITQRDRRFFPDPLQFRPERFLAGQCRQRPRFCYFPFGAGPRVCIGEHFAWQEMLLILRVLLSRWSFTLVPGQTVKPRAGMTLRPDGGLRMLVYKEPLPGEFLFDEGSQARLPGDVGALQQG